MVNAVQPNTIMVSVMLANNETGIIQVNIYLLSFNPLPDDKSLDWSKLKQTADNILKYI